MERIIAPAMAVLVLTSCQMPTSEDFARDCETQGLARGTPEFAACVQREAQAGQARPSPVPSTPMGSHGGY